MYNYIKGIVESFGPNYISLENNGIGFLVYVANPYAYKEGEEYKVYIYNNVKEEEYTLFKADSSKESFLDVVEREETDLYKKDLEDEKIELDY